MHNAPPHCPVYPYQHPQPLPSDSLASLCWPMVNQTLAMPGGAGTGTGTTRHTRSHESMDWPVSQPWRRNLGQPRCGGEGRCQGDSHRCNSKYRYGVDDVGRCPSASSCKTSYSCTQDPNACAHPCPEPEGCQRLTTRCFEWPIPRRDRCPPIDPNKDFRPPRTNLHDPTAPKPELCPTCKRPTVDLACGPLGQNY